jgi:transcriptional regulator with XRE-family HTH domain
MSGLVSSAGFRLGLALMDHWRMVLARNIERLVSREGFSKTGLAKHLGVPVQQIWRYCNGAAMPLKYLDKIQGYLGVTLPDLFEEDENTPLPPSARVPEIPEPKEPSKEEALAILAASMGYRVRRARRKKLSKIN